MATEVIQNLYLYLDRRVWSKLHVLLLNINHITLPPKHTHSNNPSAVIMVRLKIYSTSALTRLLLRKKLWKTLC